MIRRVKRQRLKKELFHLPAKIVRERAGVMIKKAGTINLHPKSVKIRIEIIDEVRKDDDFSTIATEDHLFVIISRQQVSGSFKI
jgi:hypothetical protein